MAMKNNVHRELKSYFMQQMLVQTSVVTWKLTVPRTQDTQYY